MHFNPFPIQLVDEGPQFLHDPLAEWIITRASYQDVCIAIRVVFEGFTL